MTIIEEITQTSLAKAAKIIQTDGTVVFPTETVYGLGANGLSTKACEKIFKAKGRPADNPLILHIAEIEQLELLVREISDTAKVLIKTFWPAPLTLIFPKKKIVPDIVSAGLDTVAIRMPAHKEARELIKLAKVPIAAPSANLSGSPSPTKAKHVISDLDGKVNMILTGNADVFGIESTVVSLIGKEPIILRPGSITLEMLKAVVPNTKLDQTLLSEKTTVKPLAPGMKYRHYAPKAEVYVLNNGYNDEQITAIKNNFESDKILVIKEDAESLAHNLYSHFRSADENGYQIVLVQAVEPIGIGLAVMNRLLKAASHKIL